MLSIGKAAEYLGVSIPTLRRWHKKGLLIPIMTPGGHRRYPISVLKQFYYKNNKTEIKQNIRKNEDHNKTENKFNGFYNQNVAIYARVSSSHQKLGGDLDRQIDSLVRYAKRKGYKKIKIYKDVASGLNEKRVGLWRMIDAVEKGYFNKIFCTYSDRLGRFGTYYIEKYLEHLGARVEYIKTEKENKNMQRELVDDLIAIITCFSSKLYSCRAQENFRKDSQKAINLKNDSIEYCKKNNIKKFNAEDLEHYLIAKNIKLMKRNKKFLIKEISIIS
ncbi:MAG: IS607 family transposase [Promethearchaeota archaeon]